MNFIDYLKEKWLTYVFILSSFIFSYSVYWLDNKFSVSQSNASYIVLGLAVILIIFISLDYFIFNIRIKKLRQYCRLNASSEEDLDVFAYPLDRAYAESFLEMVNKYEAYKMDISNRSSEELEFITKWIHDIKIPISSLRLIIDSNEHCMGERFNQSMETELSAIEQATQTLFFLIKSNQFYTDYKIAEIDTKKLIGEALKKYAHLFSYKKINIVISNDHFKVLTDEKWSEYIISQIFSNAIKYTPNNGSISVHTYKKKNMISIAIRNTGKGILSKDIGQIYNKGYTSSEDRTGMKSTGYGLYLSKKLCDMMGHELKVYSKYGEYAQFELCFFINDHDSLSDKNVR